MNMNYMQGKTVLVTGASAGIGKASATALAKMGAHVVMVARDKTRTEAAMAEVKAISKNDHVEMMLADLSSQRSIRQLATDFKQRHSQLHVLLNNAGGMFDARRLTEDGIELTFALNHLGYFLLTNLLLDVLKASAPARVVSVSSMMQAGGSINFKNLQGEKSYSAMGAYGNSKLANVLFTYELARRLAGTGVTANCLHPGVVNSRFGRDGDLNGVMKLFGVVLGVFGISPEQGADTSVYLASAPEVASTTGKYFDKRKEVRTQKQSYDLAIAKRLWDVSETLTK